MAYAARILLSNGSRNIYKLSSSLPACGSLVNYTTPSHNTGLFQHRKIQYVQHPFGSRAASSTPVDLKWEATTDLLGQKAITGAILPFAEQNFFQMIIFPYTYSVMYYMDFLLNHMPWWMAIVGTTATIRLLFFPLVVKQNIMGIKISNLMPETQKIQVRINEAMCSGNSYETALQRTKLKLLYDEHGVSVLSRLWPLFIQAPMFVSVFFLLRKLASYPVESMLTGGALWFSDLTLQDPFYILPAVACTSTYLLMHFGLEGTSGPLSTMGPAAKWSIRGLPLVLFAFVHSFPSAVLLFWTTNNLFTLFYALLLKTNFAKKKLNIPERLVHDPASLPLTNQTFSSMVKLAGDRARSRRTTMDVRRLDDIAFKKAGIGPLRKTYAEPPKVRNQ